MGETLNEICTEGDCNFILRSDNIAPSGSTSSVTFKVKAKLNELITDLSSAAQKKKHSVIKKYNPSDECYFEESCHIAEKSNSLDDEDFSIPQARVAKGQRTKSHY